MSTVNVLVVDPHHPEAEALQDGLAEHGMTVLHAGDKRAALQRFFADRPNAVVIDSAAPGMPPFQLLERLRSLCDVPVLIIAPPCGPEVAVEAFDAGADDFVARPIHIEELAARLRAILRRSRGETVNAGFMDGHLEVDFQSLEARTSSGIRVDLTPLQFRLLASLVRNRNQVLTPQQLLELAWGPSADSLDRVKVQVSNVRDRLVRAGVAKSVVQTVKGVGYRYRGS